MMDRKQAAQYFIVAWVKDWTLRTYLGVLADGGPVIPFDQAQALYPWLPDAATFDYYPVRAYLAEVSRPLSDALLDAASDRARLQLAPQVEAFVFTERIPYGTGRGRAILRAMERQMDRRRMLIAGSRESLQRRRGTHWAVCK